MESIEIEIEEFLKNNPNYKAFLTNYIEKEKAEIYYEVGTAKKEELIEKFKKLYNVATFKKSVLPKFKYKLELLKNDNSDLKLLKESLSLNELYDWKTNNTVTLYRVISTDNCSTESKNSHYTQYLLLHGTKPPNVEGILKTGFKPSEKGSYGPGVYITNSIKCAYGYARGIAREQGLLDVSDISLRIK